MDSGMEKGVSRVDDGPASQTEPEANAAQQNSATQPRERKHYSFYLSILMLSMIALIVTWDVTALSLALPVIADELHGTNFQSFWASIAYILGIAVTQPIYASISDVVGRKYALYASILLFGIGCIIFATATEMNVIVAGRLIKGLGGGGLDVLQTIILCDITTLKERPRWLGVLSMANAVGAVTGPFIGGAFSEQIGWPWLGWINLITVGITFVLAFFFLHLTPIEGDIKDKMRKLDWSGFALFTVIGTAVALPLSWADTLYGWGSWQTLVSLIIGLLLLVPFAFVEKRAAVPMIPYQIFDNVSIITGTVSGFLYGSMMNAILLYLPLFFQAVYLQTPSEAAKSTLPLCCLLVAMSIIASLLIDWSRKYRIAMWAGWSFITIFLGLNYTIGGNTSRAQAYAFQALLGAGLGTALASTMIAVLASVRRVDDEGLAVGMLVTVRFVGSLIGLAICSTIFSSIFQKGLSALKDLPEQLAILEDPSQAVGFIPRLREIKVSEDIMQVVTGAYEDAFQTIWVVLAAFSGLGALLSVLTREHSLEKDDVGRQGFKAPSSE
ncbi:MFS general substrate transporter [Westerdykella ornata]|uniref:MFS general substrate transporter n=1 Tax=Westerdykella ornata TaxID=318751 RepID=A0A6A6J774_WESOR|nr:MFS general substrate transporter [Westerdykella ornata]KAF2272262.1 MFS general substrate transporter [Westerdykella ornata]